MVLSPSLSYIVKFVVPKLVIPPATAYALFGLLNHLGRTDVIPLSLRTRTGFTAGSFGLTIAYIILKAWYNNLLQWRERRALGAMPVPVVKGRWPGNLDVLLKLMHHQNTDYVSQIMEDWSHEYGTPYNIRLLGEDVIVTTNPAHVKRITATDFPIWEKGPILRSAMKSVLGNGVFNSDGETWKFHRSMTRPFFSKERVVDYEIFDRHSEHAIALIKERCRTGDPIDFQDIAGRFTMDSATEFLFGRSVDSLSAPLPLPNSSDRGTNTGNAFTDSFRDVLLAIVYRLIIGENWPMLELKDATAPGMKTLHDYMEPIIDEAFKTEGQRQLNKDTSENETFLEHLIAVTEDRIVIRDELLNILLAARDTTSHAITAIIYFLATSDKTVLETLKREITETVGDTGAPTFDHVRSMKYLRAVINETLRLLPSVPANIRQSVRSSVWTGDDGVRYYIPAGVQGMWSTIGMHRRKDLWGPDALEFDPDRWLDERNKTYFMANPFIFLPFHGGPRICLGQQFALNEISFFVIRVLQAFEDIRLVPEGFPAGSLPPPDWKSGTGRKPVEQVVPRAHLTMYIQGGLWVHLKEARRE